MYNKEINHLITVLGHVNDENGFLSNIAIARLELAFKIYHTLEHSKLLLTGGFGQHFNQTDQPHAVYSKQYLLSKGIDKSAIIDTFVLSSNTIEDGKMAAPIITMLDPKEIVLVTSDFHMARALFIFQQALPTKNIITMAANTPVTPAELIKIEEHEKMQLQRLQENT